mgnify:CR=1 FL=1
MVEPLLKKGYRVIAFDGPAHGKSSGKQASLLKFKDALLAIVQQYGTPSIAIGHSLGAMAIMLACSEVNIPIKKIHAKGLSQVRFENPNVIKPAVNTALVTSTG